MSHTNEYIAKYKLFDEHQTGFTGFLVDYTNERTNTVQAESLDSIVEGLQLVLDQAPASDGVKRIHITAEVSNTKNKPFTVSIEMMRQL